MQLIVFENQFSKNSFLRKLNQLILDSID